MIRALAMAASSIAVGIFGATLILASLQGMEVAMLLGRRK
jgi:hypothetical protein